MTSTLTLPVAGALGVDAGPASNGVLVGALGAAAPTAGLLEARALTDGKCVTDDGGTYVDESTPFNESTGDDVELLPATPAQEDAVYFGHLTKTFGRVDINLTTNGDGVWTITWEVWNGTAWVEPDNLVDGTTGFTAGTGFASVTFDIPATWPKTQVDGLNAYWIRARVSAYTSVVTAPQAGQGFIVAEAAGAVFTDDTTDIGDAGTDDADLLPAYPVVGDGFYFGAAERFAQLTVTVGQERTGTATITWKYWNGSAWVAIPTLVDGSAGFSASPGAAIVSFAPPDDWAANTAANGPDGTAGYFVKAELTAITSVTQQPIATIASLGLLTTGAVGIPSQVDSWVRRLDAYAQTVSATNADSVFVLLNTRSGKGLPFTWTQAQAADGVSGVLEMVRGDELVLLQVQEDGTTEFADAAFVLTF